MGKTGDLTTVTLDDADCTLIVDALRAHIAILDERKWAASDASLSAAAFATERGRAMLLIARLRP